MDCTHYMEQFFPRAAQRSVLAQLPLNTILNLEVLGPGGGQWSCEWRSGDPLVVRRGARTDGEMTYRTSTATFADVAQGRQTLPEAFFLGDIEVNGDIEKALKLAVLFAQFVQEFPYPSSREAADVVCAG